VAAGDARHPQVVDLGVYQLGDHLGQDRRQHDPPHRAEHQPEGRRRRAVIGRGGVQQGGIGGQPGREPEGQGHDDVDPRRREDQRPGGAQAQCLVGQIAQGERDRVDERPGVNGQPGHDGDLEAHDVGEHLGCDIGGDDQQRACHVFPGGTGVAQFTTGPARPEGCPDCRRTGAVCKARRGGE